MSNGLIRNIVVIPPNAATFLQIRTFSIVQSNGILHSSYLATTRRLRFSRSLSLNWPRQSNNNTGLDPQVSDSPPPLPSSQAVSPTPTVRHTHSSPQFPTTTPNNSHPSLSPPSTSDPSQSISIITTDASTTTTTLPLSVRLRIHSPVLKQKNCSKWTPEIDTQLLSLRSQGKTWKEIGETLNRSRQSCNRRYDAILNPESGTKFWEKHPDRVLSLIDLQAQGWTWTEIASSLGTKAASCESQWKKLERERLKMLTNTTVQDISAIDVVIEQGSELVQEQCKRNKDMIQGKPLLRFNSSLVPVLMNAVAEYGTDQWETISVKVFGSKVTPEYLKHHYLRLEQKRKTWTDQQLEQLINAVSDVCDKSQHRVESDPVISTVTTSRARIDSVLDESHWDQIAKSLPGEHTAIECRERWIRMKIGRGGQRRIDSIAGDTCENNPKEINTSDSSEKQSKSKATKSTTESYTRWTAEQTHRLEAIVNSARERSDWKHNGWENVAELMNHEFTKAQCKARWVRLEREIKDRNISTGPWSREEVQDLIKGINEFGPNWIKIREKWVQGRTASFCQGKWSRLKTRLNLEMTIRRCSWSRVCKEIYGDEMGEILGRLPERWPTICDMPVKKNVI